MIINACHVQTPLTLQRILTTVRSPEDQSNLETTSSPRSIRNKSELDFLFRREKHVTTLLTSECMSSTRFVLTWSVEAEHYNDVIMGATASQITNLMIVYSTVYSGADQRKYQSSDCSIHNETSLFWVMAWHQVGDRSLTEAVMAKLYSVFLCCLYSVKRRIHIESISIRLYLLSSKSHGQYTLRNDPLQWRHNERAGVSNHQPRDCLLNRLFRRRSKKISKLRTKGQ